MHEDPKKPFKMTNRKTQPKIQFPFPRDRKGDRVEKAIFGINKMLLGFFSQTAVLFEYKNKLG
jgi:hypothetical protein